MTLLEWIALLLGVACVVLGVVRSVWTFPTAMVSVSLLGLLAAREKLYSDALLQIFYVGANLAGWINWSRSRERSGAVVVARLSWAARGWWGAGVLVATLVWGASMARLTDAAFPWWDAAVTVASMAAQWLMAQRRWENWVVWIAVDAAAVPLYHLKHLDIVAALYLIYLFLSIWGLADWRRAGRTVAGNGGGGCVGGGEAVAAA